MRVIGLDAGSTTTKGVLFEEGQIINKAIMLTAGNPTERMQMICDELGRDEHTKLVTTGYGRKLIASDKSLTEITCHAKGAHYLYPEVRNIIDIGGQDSKVIRLDELGAVSSFLMNDKCAAGTGRFLEVLMHTLGEDIAQLDSFIVDGEGVKINSMCTVFAESEVVSLIAKGYRKEEVARGVLDAIVRRISNQYLKNQPIKQSPIFFSGGLAQSKCICKILADQLETDIITDELSQFAGAIGAGISLK